MEAQNGGLEAQKEPWMVYRVRPVVAYSHHSDEKQQQDPERIGSALM
jgi:hypothetical protein